MPSYTYFCPDCEAKTYEQFKFSERPETIKCLVCQGTAEYRIDMPGITRASYVDGTKRKGWSEIREANKLVQAAAVSKPDTAKEIRKEIKKMGVRVEK
jgi:hypothetical protein